MSATRPLVANALFLSLATSYLHAQGGSGHTDRDGVLLGMHFLHSSLDCNARTGGIEDIVPTYWDYVRYMPEDLEHFSYADFWHWWYEFERYKGDEKGLEEMDAIVDSCLEHGMKVKIDLSWSTWWTEDLDWESGPRLAHGPPDLDDWAHLAELVGRRYRGRVAVWHPQGEANDLKGYWRGKPIEHVHEVYRIGARAFKMADPDVRVSVAGASPSVPREALDAWVESNVKALKGLFDDVPMNFFADIADPYRGLPAYYGSIRNILDENGAKDAEVGSGESSFQWAESSQSLPVNPPRSLDGLDPEKLPLCELKQAWRFNESMRAFFGLGGNKFVLWGTEYAPGGGWTWRWGFRKYQDWWGTWPESHKIPGTNIVYRFDPSGGPSIDLRPGWSSRATDPFHPIWEVHKFWAQATPSSAEAVRIPSRLESASQPVKHLATYLQALDRVVVLCHGDVPAGAQLTLDLGRTGWEDGMQFEVFIACDSIDLGTGRRARLSHKTISSSVKNGSTTISLPALSAFTTMSVLRQGWRPLNVQPILLPRLLGSAQSGKPLEWLVAVCNAGNLEWAPGAVLLGIPGQSSGAVFPILERVLPGQTATLTVTLPAPEAEGRVAFPLRLRSAAGQWFGPLFHAVARVSDPGLPRKLVAHRGAEHVKVQWFAPENARDVASYELFRAEGREAPSRLLAELKTTEYLDKDVQPDRAYYYHVVAVSNNGSRSRPSIVDNARVSSRPRLYDAEVADHAVPREVSLGALVSCKVTLKNTGTRPWDLGQSRFHWSSTRLWGEEDEAKLPRIRLGDSGIVAPGESIAIDLPFAAPRVGRFENHWILTLDPVGKARAYFGTPLLVESVVKER